MKIQMQTVSSTESQGNSEIIKFAYQTDSQVVVWFLDCRPHHNETKKFMIFNQDAPFMQYKDLKIVDLTYQDNTVEVLVTGSIVITFFYVEEKNKFYTGKIFEREELELSNIWRTTNALSRMAISK